MTFVRGMKDKASRNIWLNLGVQQMPLGQGRKVTSFGHDEWVGIICGSAIMVGS